MKLKCKRCGYSWERRGANYPKSCPGCKSPYWEKELTPYWEHIREKNRQKRLVIGNDGKTTKGRA